MGMVKIRRVSQKFLYPVVILLVVVMTVGLFYITLPKSQTVTGSYQGPSVKIDGKKVSDAMFNEYINRASQQAQQYAQLGMQISAAQLRDTAVQIAIRDFVIQKEVKKLKLKGLDKEAEALLKKYMPTEEELQGYMEQQGIANKKDLIKSIVKSLEEQKLYINNAKKAKIKVSKAEIDSNLDQVTVSHILIALKDETGKTRTDAEALQRADEVYQKLAAKGDFAKLVKEYSDDPGSKDKDGVYGPMPLAQLKKGMVKEFVDTALSLKVGEYSKPVKTAYGYHIIKLIQHAMPTGSDYKKKYTEAAEAILLQKYTQSPAYTKWLEKAMADAESKMEILDPAIRGYRLAQKGKWEEAAKAYEKALKHKYYKSQWEVYLDAAKAYIKAKEYSEAQTVLKKIPAEYQDMFNYQVTLATIYKESNQPQKALSVLQAYGSKHAQDKVVHEQIQQQFTEWKMTAAAAKEAALLEKMKQKEEADALKYEQQLKQKNGQAQSSTVPQSSAQPQSTDTTQSAAPSPAKTATK